MQLLGRAAAFAVNKQAQVNWAVEQHSNKGIESNNNNDASFKTRWVGWSKTRPRNETDSLFQASRVAI